jgi:hypothetical protein
VSLSREESFSRIWLATDADRINLVEFIWVFTDEARPGVESTHIGVVDIVAANLGANAEHADISVAIWNALSPQIDELFSFHEHQLAFEYSMASASVVKVAGVTSAEIDAERDRRIDAGFYFDGALFQARPEDRENIAGAKAAASDAITIFGAQPGNLAWRQLLDPTAPAEFRWIAADNSTVAMDAQTAMRFGYTALSHKEAHIFAGFLLKQQNPRPADFATNPSYWPQSAS